MQMRHALPLFFLIAWLAGCASDPEINPREVDRSSYGTDWPLTVDDGLLACELGRSPTFTVDGSTYSLHETDPAKVRPNSWLWRIWAADSKGQEKDLSVLRRDALALCE